MRRRVAALLIAGALAGLGFVVVRDLTRGYRSTRGAKIERFYGFGPLPGCAAMITLITHGDTCCIAANVDPASITEPERFRRCLEEGFAEVLALHPGAKPPVARA